MKEKLFVLCVVAILLVVVFPLIANNTEAVETNIIPDSLQSPIRKYFTTPKILWTFDDYYICEDHCPPHKGFAGLSARIGSYGGYVGINCIFVPHWIEKKYGGQIRNYSVIPEFSRYTTGFSSEHIGRSLDFFSLPYIEVESHGWNHSENLNYATLNYAREVIDHTLWNWYNNYNIRPKMWLGHQLDGNYNISVALKEFSEEHWRIYAEDLRVQNTQRFPNHVSEIEFIGTFFDPTFGCNWGTPKITLAEAKQKFNTFCQGKEIIPIRGHPAFLNGTTQQATHNLTKWQQFIDWVYASKTYINIRHTEAIEYVLDRNKFVVTRDDTGSYVVSLEDCDFQHKVLFTNPDITKQQTWTVEDIYRNPLCSFNEDTFVLLNAGQRYRLFTDSEQPQNSPPSKPQTLFPKDGMFSSPTRIILSWTATDSDGDQLKYDVYFGPVFPLYKVKTNYLQTSYSPWILDYNRQYYWKIVVHDSHDLTTTGDQWTFTTKKNW